MGNYKKSPIPLAVFTSFINFALLFMTVEARLLSDEITGVQCLGPIINSHILILNYKLMKNISINLLTNVVLLLAGLLLIIFNNQPNLLDSQV